MAVLLCAGAVVAGKLFFSGGEIPVANSRPARATNAPAGTNESDAAREHLRQMPPGNERDQALISALQEIGQRDPRRALALAAELAVTREQKAVYHILFDDFAKRDLPSAVDLLKLAPEGEARENALRTVADHWSAKDFSGALDWAKNISDASERSAATESVLMSLAVTDPKRALDLAAQNLDSAARDRVSEKSLRRLVDTDPSAAAKIIAALPEGEPQRNAAMLTARARAVQNPAAAIAWLQNLPAATQPVVLNNVLDVWLKSDANAAAKFVAQMPAGSVQDAAISRFAENWAVKDSAAAMAWAQTLPGGSAQNAAVISAASGWARTDAAAATQWAQTLPVENPARGEAWRGAFSYWELADKTAAQKFLEKLSAADREILKPAAK